MSHQTNRQRVEILDPLRGLAALAVAWYHFTNCSELVQTDWLRASGKHGWLGVDMFFVISGFVIPYSMYCGAYRPRRDLGRFLAKRLVRLEPPYLVSIVLALLFLLLRFVAGVGGERPPLSAPQLLLHLGYLNTFFGYPWLNEVYWTLGIEFQYYLFLAVAYPLLAAKSHRLGTGCVLVLAGGCLLFNSPTLVFHFLGLFAMGMLAFQHRAGIISGRLFVAALAGVTLPTTLRLSSRIALVGCATALAIAFLPTIRHWVVRVFVYLGGISYSLYLLHPLIGGPVVSLGARYSSGLAWEVLVLAVAIAASVAAAIGLHRLVEMPAQRLSSRISYSSSARVSPLPLVDSPCHSRNPSSPDVGASVLGSTSPVG
jgi:peptidoglycan/LPS O-acetylase OafA/YrhL